MNKQTCVDCECVARSFIAKQQLNVCAGRLFQQRYERTIEWLQPPANPPSTHVPLRVR